ncbi:MAG TPA: ATP-binding protein [Polaromonas sp.]|uniref:hybrid sensor histidine kinase/response regulator n=1 Tax=Polaromonas sp. TaxID=1869339 RepID=UPI002D46EC80|nr:ATP-binding protein [Polaromonas sp.]HYW57933.1 ATP-binding protein [Polaromonas sp.]
MPDRHTEEGLLRSVALQNAQSILLARQRAEAALLAAKQGLERKTEELAVSVAMMRATLEASRDGILVTDDKGLVTAVNQQYAQMWRLSADVLQTGDHERLVSVNSVNFENPKAFVERIAEIYRISPPESFDLLNLRDGRIFERASKIQFVEGRNVGRVWVFRDITEQRRAEEALQDETRMLELINKTGTSLTAKLEVRELVQAVTDAATEISGARFGAFFYKVGGSDGSQLFLYTLSGAPRDAFEKFGHPRATALFGPTFSGAPPVRIDDVTQDTRYGHMLPHLGMPAGHPKVRSFLAVPVASGSGDVIGALFFGHPKVAIFNERAERLVVGIAAQAGVAIDNARLYEVAKEAAQEREKLLEAERAARADAEQMSRMKDEFLAMLAHELRNPLAPLRNSVEILRRVATNPAELEQTRAVMDRQIAHMTRLVDDLLDVSRISRGKLELRLDQVTLADALRSAVETSRPAMTQRQHDFRVTLPDESVTVTADLVRLSQAFTNLLNNAARYTPESGVVELRAELAEGGVRVTVEDNGIGIPAHLHARVFDMFVQAEPGSSTSKTQGGLGIGLTLVRKIVEMHGGYVRAENCSKGDGCKFVVWLPVSEALPEVAVAPGQEAPGAVGVQSVRRILVVDDNVDAAATLAQLLSMMGHELRIANDGVEAIEAAAEFRPDMIFLDIGMPRMDGYEACRKIRKMETLSKTTIVALTGWGQADDKRKTREAGFDHHLTKPVDLDQLEELTASHT